MLLLLQLLRHPPLLPRREGKRRNFPLTWPCSRSSKRNSESRERMTKGRKLRLKHELKKKKNLRKKKPNVERNQRLSKNRKRRRESSS
jgi:hypothetical protein